MSKSPKAVLLVAASVIVVVARGQVTETGPTFTVASVKRASFTGPPVIQETNVRINYTGVTLLGIVRRAYRLRPDQLIGISVLGSGTEVYNLTANLPENSTKNQIPGMLRHLLAERFQLVVHWETKETQAYVLSIGAGGLRLKPCDRPTDPDEGNARKVRAIGDTKSGRMHVEGCADLGRFAEVLSGNLRQVDGRPVIDMTETAGEFEIFFDATLPVASLEEDAPVELEMRGGKKVVVDAPPIFSAVQRLGLKLERKRVPVEYLVVDSVNKQPTEN
jgi:uncharacterized protein (TIGR03435 family)